MKAALVALLGCWSATAWATTCDGDDVDERTVVAPGDGEVDWPSDGAIWFLMSRYALDRADPPGISVGGVPVPLRRVGARTYDVHHHAELVLVPWRPTEPWQPGVEYLSDQGYDGRLTFSSSGEAEAAEPVPRIREVTVSLSPPELQFTCGGMWDLDSVALDADYEGFLMAARLSDVDGRVEQGVDAFDGPNQAPVLDTTFRPGRRYTVEAIGVDRSGREQVSEPVDFVAPLAGCQAQVDVSALLIAGLAGAGGRRRASRRGGHGGRGGLGR